MPFTGHLKLTIIEATSLQPTELSLRNSIIKNPNIDPYVDILIDDSLEIGKTTVKLRTSDPSWNEVFTSSLLSAKNLQLTIFDQSAFPDDNFVANCSLLFDNFKLEQRSNVFDLWVRF